MAKSITAEVITIGDEILFGHITDTNTQWIGAELTAIGVRPAQKTSVGDVKADILRSLNAALAQHDVVIITGGLGPTKDDITKQTLCEFFETSLEIHPEALEEVTAFFAKRGRELTAINKQQALLPIGGTYLANKWGTAPGMWFEKEGKVVVSLPGVPFEMKHLMREEVLPRLSNFFELPVIVHKTMRTIGIGESFLAERISEWEDALPSHLKLAYLPSFSGVKLRLTGNGRDKSQLEKEIQNEIDACKPIISEYIYGYDDLEIEEAVGQALAVSNRTVGVAESCTGGMVAHKLTSISGSSAYFMGGVVSYSNDAKGRVLGVQNDTLKAHGAVSEQTAKEMAEGARKLLQTDYALATTGIAGPTGGTPEKPVGTVWIACSGPNGTQTKLLRLGNLRDVNIELTTMHVLNLLRQTLLIDTDALSN